MGFIKFVLIFIIIVYAIRILSRFLLKRFMKKLHERATGGQQHYDNQPSRKEGEVVVEQATLKKEKKTKKDDRDYIDYEEIKE